MKQTILQILQGKGELKQKKLWKKVCKKLDSGDENDETSIKQFENVLKELLEEKDILEIDGQYTINKAKKAIPQTNTKRKAGLDTYKDTEDGNNDADEQDETEEGEQQANKRVKLANQTEKKKYQYVDLWKNGERYWKEGLFDTEYLQTNPDGITRLFCGNLNKKITEDELHSCLPGITYIKWITDKETGEFYGSSFLEMQDPASAAAAVMKDGSKFMGRPLKIYYCPPKPGAKWPPHAPSTKPETSAPSTAKSNNSGGGKGGGREFPKSEKPEGCRKLFAGNLSYEIDDDTMVDFFKECGTIIGLRWLSHKDSGDFKVITV